MALRGKETVWDEGQKHARWHPNIALSLSFKKKRGKRKAIDLDLSSEVAANAYLPREKAIAPEPSDQKKRKSASPSTGSLRGPEENNYWGGRNKRVRGAGEEGLKS